MKRIINTVTLLLVLMATTKAQFSKEQSYNELIQKIGKQQSANSKDILSNFLQAGISKLLTDKNAISINPTLYAIDSLMFIGHRSNVDTVYRKQRVLRNIQLLDSVQFSNFKTNFSKVTVHAIQVGFKISVINKRDIRFADYSPQLDFYRHKYEDIRKNINLSLPEQDQQRITASWKKYAQTHNYQDLDPLVRSEVEKLSPEDQSFVKLSAFHQKFIDLADEYARKPLMVFSPVYTYDFKNSQPAYSFLLDYSQGLTKDINKSPWEIELKTGFVIEKDTTKEIRNLDYKVWSSSGGVNKVLHRDNDKKSTMEIKLFLEYDYFTNKPNGINPSNLTFNSIYRIKLFKSVWVPVTLSYDPEHSNFLGYFSLAFNIDK